jgi:hypothetical protein
MSEDDRVQRCPRCTHTGGFDGQGPETDTFERYRSDPGGWEKVKELWYQFHCPDCGCVFQVREREVVEEAG